ncbi:hypothetical protein JHK82_035664 [Glycine max]|uniref:Uncharacterized protein n=1 Tax=Glycine max TaxID=3847 RepID=A0A0R0GK56_SOYBN|nr:hypothetical protein JHK82_035664 [Glycine max]KAG5129673.1 hypothetical protein JHK84_036070 [Glycine max]
MEESTYPGQEDCEVILEPVDLELKPSYHGQRSEAIAEFADLVPLLREAYSAGHYGEVPSYLQSLSIVVREPHAVSLLIAHLLGCVGQLVVRPRLCHVCWVFSSVFCFV